MSEFREISNIGRRESDIVAGNAAKRVFGDPADLSKRRRGVQVCNHDSSLRIYVRLAAAGGSAPSIADTNHDFNIPPLSTLLISANQFIDLWIENSSNTAATSAYSALEVA